MKPHFLVYTDGGSHGNPGKGAWAFVVFDGFGVRKGSKSKGFSYVTNNQMEMEAVLQALIWANTHGYLIEILTDSQFTINGATKWMDGWATNNWTKKSSGEIKNLDQWKKIYDEYHKYRINNGECVTFTKVKAHSGNVGNEAVDTLVQVVITERELEDW